MSPKDREWVLATEQSGYTRHFDAIALPVSLGGDSSNDIVLADVEGSVQIGQLDGVFFAQPGRGTGNLRLDGERLLGSRRVADGSLISLDTARLHCELRDGRLRLRIEAQVTAGDTAPPDFAALTREQPGAMTISPIAFKPAATLAAGVARPRWKRSTPFVVAAFVVLATLGWFAFTAKSVRFEFEPAAQSFELTDTWFKFRLGDRYLLRPGEHRLKAGLDGYYPLDQAFDVGADVNQTVTLQFVRLPGLIAFDTDPAVAAEVRLDGELIGTTPLTDFEVRPGTHQVQFTAERYLSELVSLEVEGGHTRQALTAGLTPSWAPVSVSSQPPGAEVRVDGRFLGTTPSEFELTAGERDIEVSMAGRNPWRRQIRVVADEPQTLPEIALELADARIALDTTPADASINLNGRFLGRTPIDLSLPPNVRHELNLSKPGYQSKSVTLELVPAQRESVRVDLEPELGTIEVASTPPGAEVRIDGEPVGTTPLTVERMTVEQQIAVRLEGFAAQDARITPRPRYPQRLDFDLVRLDQSTGGGYAPIVTTGFGQRMRLIPAGEFQMGSSRSDDERRQNETLRYVQLTRAFYLAETEMTNAQFRAGCDPGHDSGTFGGLSLNDDDQPVVNVAVQMIYACLNRLSIADGLQPVYEETNGLLAPTRPMRNGYRLPTEAEFAWALRAAGRDDPEPLRFSWGQELPPPDRVDNIGDLSASQVLDLTMISYTDGAPVSAPVGSFEPNAMGLYDMGGNVAEWVQDLYDPIGSPGEDELVDPLGPERGSLNIIRGPSWQSATTRRLRLAYRDFDNGPRADVGFRIARNLE